ncbi:unnamed protein product [Protopolystoma xenopodis]|uniref:Uncharacterized protein n=1 Tax=Protopolystoma xenopodis TaxID=117903 RepID=A0A448XFZ1_9PLAT|nr:unnamed protein product [Protopolystoma xenopodis]
MNRPVRIPITMLFEWNYIGFRFGYGLPDGGILTSLFINSIWSNSGYLYSYSSRPESLTSGNAPNPQLVCPCHEEPLGWMAAKQHAHTPGSLSSRATTGSFTTSPVIAAASPSSSSPTAIQLGKNSGHHVGRLEEVDGLLGDEEPLGRAVSAIQERDRHAQPHSHSHPHLNPQPPTQEYSQSNQQINYYHRQQHQQSPHHQPDSPLNFYPQPIPRTLTLSSNHNHPPNTYLRSEGMVQPLVSQPSILVIGQASCDEQLQQENSLCQLSSGVLITDLETKESEYDDVAEG